MHTYRAAQLGWYCLTVCINIIVALTVASYDDNNQWPLVPVESIIKLECIIKLKCVSKLLRVHRHCGSSLWLLVHVMSWQPFMIVATDTDS